MNEANGHTWTSASPAATTASGQRLGTLLTAGDVVALDGPLGAGKTQFVRGLAEGMGLDPGDVSSPTFVMMQEYEPDTDTADSTCPLFHLDAYRIAGPDDLASLGFDADLRATGVSVVEWAARLEAMPDALGPDVIYLALTHAPGDTRSISLTARGRWAAPPRFQTLLTTLCEPRP